MKAPTNHGDHYGYYEKNKSPLEDHGPLSESLVPSIASNLAVARLPENRGIRSQHYASEEYKAAPAISGSAISSQGLAASTSMAGWISQRNSDASMFRIESSFPVRKLKLTWRWEWTENIKAEI